MSPGKESVEPACEDDIDERRGKVGAHVRRVLQKMIDRRSETFKQKNLASANAVQPDGRHSSG